MFHLFLAVLFGHPEPKLFSVESGIFYLDAQSLTSFYQINVKFGIFSDDLHDE
jgi:hypothetical protein